MTMENVGLRTPGVLSVVFGAQGAFLLANAVYTLANPSAASNLPDSPLAGVPNHTVRCIGVTSLSTGTIYAIASYQRNIPIMVASLPGRLFAGYVFYRNGGAWTRVAIFEVCMGLVNAAALAWDLYL
ncbi:hypothetical protein N7517_002186 [Penicillium concentricum]|uniref:Uncharacterized protein n=1 Tax=Penicillium concentricum TaxID=293559 RepID=A0A9W9STI5_9EURO|nr:uncharacterized protein N7517_002186 [Penicillium concentricum]KAJ5384275.1 hypothetical protein N7517_002186 [Penicillium concentricum]